VDGERERREWEGKEHQQCLMHIDASKKTENRTVQIRRGEESPTPSCPAVVRRLSRQSERVGDTCVQKERQHSFARFLQMTQKNGSAGREKRRFFLSEIETFEGGEKRKTHRSHPPSPSHYPPTPLQHSSYRTRPSS
jgi:hypothetical protein